MIISVLTGSISFFFISFFIEVITRFDSLLSCAIVDLKFLINIKFEKLCSPLATGIDKVKHES